MGYPMLTRACTAVANLWRNKGNERGNVAIVVALSALPLSVAAVGAVDVTRDFSARAQIQDGLDAAVLAAGRASGNDANLLQTTGQRVLSQNLALTNSFQLASSNFAFGTNGLVTGTASVTVTPLLVGGPHTITASSQVQRNQDRLEVALVLDNTGSMAGTKLSTLKTDAAQLIDTLVASAQASTDPTPLKISLVPFSNTVRVQGTTSLSGYSATSHSGGGIPTWLDPQAKSRSLSGRQDIFSTANTDRFGKLQAISQSWAGCVETRPAPYDVQETPPSSTTPDTMFVPYFWADEPHTNPNNSSYNNYLADGTVTNSWMPLERNPAKYTGSITTGTFSVLGMTYNKGPNAGCTMQPLIRLTTNTASVKTGITNMAAIGETNIPMGLMWGWHTLTPNAPFADGSPYGTPHVRKIVILMTDGENTDYSSSDSNNSFYGGLGWVWQGISSLTASMSQTDRTTAIDARLTQLCTNMKAQNIEIYTIRIDVTDGPSPLLQGCASTPSYFFDVPNVANLGAAFSAIAGSISNLRISK
jgi:Flp pilus assembly protein TadG